MDPEEFNDDYPFRVDSYHSLLIANMKWLKSL